MTPSVPQETNTALIERAEEDLRNVAGKHFGKRDARLTSQHLYLAGIAARALSQAKAFRWAVAERNSLVAAALVRMQLDTVLRLYALWWVDDPAAFAGQVVRGKAINRLKAADGQPLTDKYLCDRLKAINPWVPEVYAETSGYIHFSNRHIRAAFTIHDPSTGTGEMHIGPGDYGKGPEYYGELERAFFHISAMIPVAVDDWLERFA